ncbi:hypothetical protein [Pseudomarimonas arenosa]|uniref:Uncharacterized protein n=1 Tax=Pseudomarimonas arenosa TaxID=2774145 RepID=A0AAW3ZUF5_9GAMM|nr:hypothetical protein [Pseudomarimonas arenosa]MBD8528340.1 hypothetical protein [Pseudomarimonas arenosa]
MPAEPEAKLLGALKRIAPSVSSATLASNFEYAVRIHREANGSIGFGDLETWESHIGVTTTAWEPAGGADLGDLHAHPLAGPHTINENDLYFFEQGGDFTRKVGGKVLVKPGAFSPGDLDAYRAEGQNGWMTPAGSNKLLYFPVAGNANNCHYEYDY